MRWAHRALPPRHAHCHTSEPPIQLPCAGCPAHLLTLTTPPPLAIHHLVLQTTATGVHSAVAIRSKEALTKLGITRAFSRCGHYEADLTRMFSRC